MSISDSSPRFTLRIRVADEYKYLVKVSVFSSENRIISQTEILNYQYLFQLKKGLYTVRVEMNAEISDKVITVNSDKEYLVSSEDSQNSNTNIIEPPKQFSSALLEGRNVKTYGSSHEYYTYPAIDFSKRDTFFYGGNITPISNSSLFIFMRFPSIEKYTDLRSRWSKSFYRDFELVDEEGESIIQFEARTGLEVNENDGWLAFNALLPHGIYYLIYRGAEPRQIPIYVFKNWHTQFFITLGKEPLFGSTRIFISRQREFNPKEETHKYIDILLDKLQNRDYSVDEELIKIAAYGKYESPMFGLICSYVYFKSSQTKSDNLFNVIIQNMQNVILKDNDDSPDLRALNILAAEHFGKTDFKKTTVKGTPMLRIGFEVIKNAAVKNRNLISKNSVNDFVSETLYYDSPFNTFKPIPSYKQPESSSQSEMIDVSFEKEKIDLHSMPDLLVEKDKAEESKSMKEFDPNVDKFSISIQDYLKPNIINFINDPELGVESESSWVKNSVSDMLNKNADISINDISSQLNLSGNTITRIFDSWKEEFEE